MHFIKIYLPLIRQNKSGALLQKFGDSKISTTIDWISEIQKANAQLAWSMAALTTHDKFILPKTVEQVACRYYLFVCSLGTNSWINDSVSFQYWQKDSGYFLPEALFMHQYRLTINEQHHYIYTNFPPAVYTIYRSLECHNSLLKTSCVQHRCLSTCWLNLTISSVMNI